MLPDQVIGAVQPAVEDREMQAEQHEVALVIQQQLSAAVLMATADAAAGQGSLRYCHISWYRRATTDLHYVLQQGICSLCSLLLPKGSLLELLKCPVAGFVHAGTARVPCCRLRLILCWDKC